MAFVSSSWMCGGVVRSLSGSSRELVCRRRYENGWSLGLSRQARMMRMMQSPFNDGPPPIEDYFKPRVVQKAEPLKFGTGRVVVSESEGDVATAMEQSIEKALQALGSDSFQLAHVTLSLGLDYHSACDVLESRCGNGDADGAKYMLRTVAKKDTPDQIEVLLIAAPEPVTLAFAVEEVEEGVSLTVQDELDNALNRAAKRAVDELVESNTDPTFFLFCHSPGGSSGAVRDVLSTEFGDGTIAYGGNAAAEAIDSVLWAAVGNGDGRKVLAQTQQSVVVAGVTGSMSFMTSAVVKNWAQPAFAEPLSFMVPRYVSDPALDLLTAIKYDDWDTFERCLDKEDGGVEVNHKWSDKQNQMPLLAACARCRTKMARYLLERGADVEHRNDGGFTAMMYTRLLEEFDTDMVREQLELLSEFGARTKLTDDEIELIAKATAGRLNK